MGGGGGRADNAGQLVLVAYICSIVDRGAVMHYGVKQEGGPAFRQIYAMKKILQSERLPIRLIIPVLPIMYSFSFLFSKYIKSVRKSCLYIIYPYMS